MWKDRRFWVCGLLFTGLFWLSAGLEHIDQYHPFPFILAFHALTLFSWMCGLYRRWSGRRNPGDGRAWGLLVLLCALPQIPMCMVSFVSWALLGLSLAMGMGAAVCSR